MDEMNEFEKLVARVIETEAAIKLEQDAITAEITALRAEIDILVHINEVQELKKKVLIEDLEAIEARLTDASNAARTVC